MCKPISVNSALRHDIDYPPLFRAGFVRTNRIIDGSKDAVPILGDDFKHRVSNLFLPEMLLYACILVLPLL